MIPTDLFHINAARVRRGEGPSHVRPLATVSTVRGEVWRTGTPHGEYRASECYPTMAEARQAGLALIKAERQALAEAYRASLNRLNNATFACRQTPDQTDTPSV